MRSSLVVRLRSSLFVLPFSLLPACGGGEGSTDTLAITPAAANVATCRTAMFAADPADGVTWSLEGEGALKDGLYTAPISAPAPPEATITATRGTASAEATITLATAFPEAPIDTARAAASGAGDHVRGAAAKGDRAYALVEAHEGDGAVALAVTRSDDGGLTWKQPVSLPSGSRAGAVAIDAGDPDTVYVTVHTGKDHETTTLALAISTDGGQTFTTKPLYDGGTGDAEDADVASPAKDTVVVTAPTVWQDGDGGQGAMLMVFRDTARGDGFGALTDLENGYGATWAGGLEMRLPSGRLIETNSSRGGPALATNGEGTICLVTDDYGLDGSEEHHTVSCSTDAGATFPPMVEIVAGDPDDLQRARVAVSPDGSLVVAAYNTFHDVSVDPVGETAYKVSTDGGATFGAAHTLPGEASEAGDSLRVHDVEVFIDSAGIVWFARTVDDGHVSLDKSCDQGETLSGAFVLPIAGAHTNAVFFESSAGLFAGAERFGAADVGLTVTRLLPP